ncbi:hypothetical protein [Schlesneria sp. DSM 10557]|uniref:hypothetical protein n=1 Tax=Schlesneria sp. DSM 10557 TaxID=3044399 RepID=UPI00359F3F0B
MPRDVSVGRYPFLRQMRAFQLLQAARIALSPGSIAISMAATFLFFVAHWLAGDVVRTADSVNVPPITVQQTSTGELIESHVALPNRSQIVARAFTLQSFLWPWTSVFHPARTILSSDVSWGYRTKALFSFAFALGLWSLAGTVICRRAAILFGGHRESSIQAALQYSVRRWYSAIMAPLTPLFATLIAGLLIAIIGLIGRLPWVGQAWLLLSSPVILILAGAMAFLLLVTTVGWPLMVAAVATDDCDSFGALSRAYSGMTSKPWYVLSFIAVSFGAGTVLMSLAHLFADTTIWCALSSAAWGSGNERATSALFSPLSFLLRLAVGAVGSSFFWSAATISYLLLRQQVDGVPIDTVAVDDEARPAREPLPVVGIPATDVRADLNGESFSHRN